MNEKTSEALEQSITKYIGYVQILKENKGNCVCLDNIGVKLGTHNCPLCQLFVYDCCHGCPVTRNNPENKSCNNTPYPKICTKINELFVLYGSDILITEELIKAFEDELEFLISLKDEL